MAISSKSFGDLLVKHLRVADRTQGWLANRINMGTSTISDWVNHKTKPNTPELIILIADVLEVDADERQELLTAAGYNNYQLSGTSTSKGNRGETGIFNARSVRRVVSLDAVPPVGTLPEGSSTTLYHPNSRFVGRREELRAVAGLFLGEGDDGRKGLGKTAIITGLSGIGKTQLATEFAHRYGPYFEGGVFWIGMRQEASVPHSIITAASQMASLPEHYHGLGPERIEEKLDIIRAEWQKPIPRLIVFDNCDNPALLAKWRPRSGSSHVLVTSRRSMWNISIPIRIVPLSELERYQSLELLCNFRTDLNTENGVLDEIADVLGDLPLALHLAGHYLRHYASHTTLETYLSELRSVELLNHASLQEQEGDVSPTNHDRNIARSFLLSYEQLSKSDLVDSLAIKLLARAACFVGGVPIPNQWLMASLPENSSWKSLLVSRLPFFSVEEEMPKHEIRKADALYRVLELGFLREELDNEFVLHPLLAQFIRSISKSSGLLKRAEKDVGRAVVHHAREIHRMGSMLQVIPVQSELQFHLKHLANQSLSKSDEQSIFLCRYWALYLYGIGEYQEAIHYLDRAIAIRQHLSGNEHPAMTTDLNSSGFILSELGKYKEARSYLLRALSISEKYFGNDAHETLIIVDHIGIVSRDLGEYEISRSYHEKTLKVRREQPGATDIDIAHSLFNLSQLYIKSNDYETASRYLEQALTVYQDKFGNQHPNTLTIRSGIVNLNVATENYTAAHEAAKQILLERQEVLGENHPDTMRALKDVGVTFAYLENYFDAQNYLEKALIYFTQRFGLKHPNTQSAQRSLNLVQEEIEQNNINAQRLTTVTNTLETCRKELGDYHPNTIVAFGEVGLTLANLGRLNEARPYYERVLEIFTQVSGPNSKEVKYVQEKLDEIIEAQQGQMKNNKPNVSRINFD